MGNCKDCKHCKENDDFFSSQSIVMGMLLIGAPMPKYGIFGDDELECDNIKSIFYGDEVHEYDTCNNFEEK
mgnify:CR=1 FL=1